eukprot:TRINITY_DN19397_c0_g1_i1.p1 TRINITY_DN19397_c0_g1~~TRINITY_DN19397_c0_g1_i1.p1  ORF type:complete len:103 (+),score=7.53 TRINITY_DN19397_c0_g1_i1:44-352(+)
MLRKVIWPPCAKKQVKESCCVPVIYLFPIFNPAVSKSSRGMGHSSVSMPRWLVSSRDGKPSRCPQISVEGAVVVGDVVVVSVLLVSTAPCDADTTTSSHQQT